MPQNHDRGHSMLYFDSGVSCTDGNYAWTIPLTRSSHPNRAGERVLMRISDSSGHGLYSFSTVCQRWIQTVENQLYAI